MYTRADLDAHALADLESDVRQAEEQAANGPYYPDRGITADSLRAYATTCRAMIAKYKDGGAHAAVLKGE